jgi:hypothetical protein
MNPRNILRELLHLLDVSHPRDSDRTMVRSESLVILSADCVLQLPPFREPTRNLLEVLKAGMARDN